MNAQIITKEPQVVEIMNSKHSANIVFESQVSHNQTDNQTLDKPKSDSSLDDISISDNLMCNMKIAACDVSQLLKSLSHPDRLMLLCQLTQGEYCVSDLEKMVGLGQPSLSQQLGILRKENLVDTRREGKQIYYSIASEDAKALLQILYERFCS